MNHLGADLIEQLDLGVLIDMPSLGRFASRRDPDAIALEGGMHDADLGLGSIRGREVCPRRFGRRGVDLVPEL